jgi:hypothetical protein
MPGLGTTTDSGVGGATPNKPTPTFLKTSEVETSTTSPLQLRQLSSNLVPDMDTTMPQQSYYTYGDSSMASPLTHFTAQQPTKQSQPTDFLQSQLPTYNQNSALQMAGLAPISNWKTFKGGGDVGHEPEFITGKTGYYVQGRGDGQSDSIPAMLADGEYVFDADTVAALGNGSNKAGAAVLDKMRQNIRTHKRAAPSKKIPPAAKSPLEYLKG